MNNCELPKKSGIPKEPTYKISYGPTTSESLIVGIVVVFLVICIGWPLSILLDWAKNRNDQTNSPHPGWHQIDCPVCNGAGKIYQPQKGER